MADGRHAGEVIRLEPGAHVEVHPHVAGLIPTPADDEYAALKSDIARIGQQELIVITAADGDGWLIIDGLHRWRACNELAIPCLARRWDGHVSAKQLCVSLNARRRHLTKSQLALLAFENVLPSFEEEAKARQADGRRRGGETAGRGRPKNSSVEDLPPSNRAKATDQAGCELGISGKLVQAAKYVTKNAPQVSPLVSAGEIDLDLAKPLARQLQKLPSDEDRLAAVERGKTIGFRALKEVLARRERPSPTDEQALLSALRAAEKLRVALNPILHCKTRYTANPTTKGGWQRLLDLLNGFGQAGARLSQSTTSNREEITDD